MRMLYVLRLRKTHAAEEGEGEEKATARSLAQGGAMNRKVQGTGYRVQMDSMIHHHDQNRNNSITPIKTFER